jgi:hypothetical protein
LDALKNAGSAPPPKPAIQAPEEPRQDYDVSGPTQRFKTIASPADLSSAAPDRVNLLGGWGSDAVATPAQPASSSLNPLSSQASELKSTPLYENSFGVGSGGWGADPRATQPAIPGVRGEPSSNRTTLGQSIEMTGVRQTNNPGVDYATSWGATSPTIGAVASLNAHDYEERKSLLDKTPDDHLVTPVRKSAIKPEEQSLITSSHTNRIVDVRRPDDDEVMSVKSTRLNPISVTEAKAGMTIIWPQYVKTKKGFKELNKPDESQFMEIGHNKIPDEQNMHYRYYIDTELEKSEFLSEYPFHLYPLKKGQSRGLSGPFMFGAKFDKSGQKSNEREVGRFKGRIRIIPADQVEARKEKLKKYNEKKELLTTKLNDRKEGDLKAILEATEDLGDDELAQDYEIAKALLVKTSVLVRVYILEAFNLEQKDWGSASDPYVKIQLGDQVINERKNYQVDEPNPKIYKMFELSTFLPGVSVLKIKFYDFDDLFPDDHIGTTKIDLEDRFFSKQWNEITHKPIETRPLYIKTSRRPQGYVRLWIDMFPVPDKPDAWFIQPRPPAEFEARVIIWRCTDVESMDFGGVSDLFVRAWMNNSKPKETDTHFRAANGQGSWNWRLKFNVTLPYPTNVLNLQIWDRDLFSSNDYIGDACLPFDDLAKEAWATNKRLKMYGASGDWRDRALRRDNETFKVQLKRKTTQGEKDAGFLYISFELLPKEVAESCKVGEGRDEPNVDPRLPPPIGRIEWTMNPLKMMSQLVGPEMKTKALMLLCCILCCLMLIFIAPLVFSNILADIVNPFN